MASKYNDITAIYADIVAQDKANGIEKRTDEEIMADVKARLEQDEKYANGTHERDYQNPYVDAFKSYENNKVMTEARKIMSAAIYEQISCN